MSRSGDEMILELASLLNTSTVKTAAKKDEEKEEKKEKKEKAKEKEGKKEKKEDKEEKKASLIMGLVQDLVKLAGELDEAGAEDASALVDDALRSIVDGLEKKKIANLPMPSGEDMPEMGHAGDDEPPMSMDEEPDYESAGGFEDEGEDLPEVGSPEFDQQFEEEWETLARKIGPENIEKFEEWVRTGRK
jgi:hypothetical protein